MASVIGDAEEKAAAPLTCEHTAISRDIDWKTPKLSAFLFRLTTDCKIDEVKLAQIINYSFPVAAPAPECVYPICPAYVTYLQNHAQFEKEKVRSADETRARLEKEAYDATSRPSKATKRAKVEAWWKNIHGQIIFAAQRLGIVFDDLPVEASRLAKLTNNFNPKPIANCGPEAFKTWLRRDASPGPKSDDEDEVDFRLVPSSLGYALTRHDMPWVRRHDGLYDLDRDRPMPWGKVPGIRGYDESMKSFMQKERKKMEAAEKKQAEAEGGEQSKQAAGETQTQDEPSDTTTAHFPVLQEANTNRTRRGRAQDREVQPEHLVQAPRLRQQPARSTRAVTSAGGTENVLPLQARSQRLPQQPLMTTADRGIRTRSTTQKTKASKYAGDQERSRQQRSSQHLQPQPALVFNGQLAGSSFTAPVGVGKGTASARQAPVHSQGATQQSYGSLHDMLLSARDLSLDAGIAAANMPTQPEYPPFAAHRMRAPPLGSMQQSYSQDKDQDMNMPANTTENDGSLLQTQRGNNSGRVPAAPPTIKQYGPRRDVSYVKSHPHDQFVYKGRGQWQGVKVLRSDDSDGDVLPQVEKLQAGKQSGAGRAADGVKKHSRQPLVYKYPGQGQAVRAMGRGNSGGADVSEAGKNGAVDGDDEMDLDAPPT